MKKKKSYFGFKLKISYQIASLFDMYIDMGERITGEQDRPSLIIEHLPQGPQIAQNIHIFFTFGLVYEKLVFPCCTYVSTVMRSAFADISVPLLPHDFMYGPNMSPNLFYFYINSKGSYHNASIFDM